MSRRCPTGKTYSRSACTGRGRLFLALPLFFKSGPTMAPTAHRSSKQVAVDKAKVDAPSDAEVANDLGAQNTPEGPHGMVSSELLSTISLFLVAILWGTNPVCLRYSRFSA